MTKSSNPIEKEIKKNSISISINVLILLVNIWFSDQSLKHAEEANNIANQNKNAAEEANNIQKNPGRLELKMPENSKIGITRAEFGGNYSDKFVISFDVTNNGKVDRTVDHVSLTLKDQQNNKIIFKPQLQITNLSYTFPHNDKDKNFNPLKDNPHDIINGAFLPLLQNNTSSYKNIVFTPLSRDNSNCISKSHPHCFQIKSSSISQVFSAQINMTGTKIKTNKNEEKNEQMSYNFCIKISPNFEPTNNIINQSQLLIIKCV